MVTNLPLESRTSITMAYPASLAQSGWNAVKQALPPAHWMQAP
jgi:hypothetical protein